MLSSIVSVLPSSRGNFNVIVKRKRTRTFLTTHQLDALEKIYRQQQYINRDERQNIVKNLQLTDKAVMVWFQNRRMKSKKMRDQDCLVTEARSSIDVARLDLVEARIQKNTNDLGFVTLDDGVMGVLGNVLDDILSKTTQRVPDGENEQPTNIYEPISPPSETSSEEDSSVCWTPVDPDECVQRIVDLQTMFWL